jgi:hypothetical protein
MDEAGIRALLERVAGAEAPPSRVDVGLARIRGRKRLRWCRTRIAVGVPALAAAVVVVVAVVAGGAIPFGTRGQGSTTPRRATAGALGSQTVPRRFNPLVPYAAFGWLPAGRHITSVMTAGAAETVEVGGDGAKDFVGLNVYLPGRCNHSSKQVLALLRRRQHPQLACTLNWGSHGGHPTLANPVTAVAPPVNGHQAFWAEPVCNTNQCDSPGGSILVWSYAPNAWAKLADPNRTQAVAIAGKVRFGAGASQPIKFPAQLTGVPPEWQVPVVWSAPTAGVLAAQQWSAGNAASAPWLFTNPSSRTPKGWRCQLQPASAVRHQVINGYHVVTTTTAKGSQACANSADGLTVSISTGAGVTPDAIAIFAHHLRLLGPNPARWTTRPVG